MLFKFLIWRIILFAPLVIGVYLIPINLSASTSYIYHFINSNPSFESTFLNPWANFDGIHYLNIAQFGYTNQARFFPLFPLILKSALFSLTASILLVTTIFFIALHFLKNLIELDFPNQIASKTTFNILLFPTSFFFISLYSEGLFLLLAVLSFYFARRRMWVLSIIFATFLTATRFVGIAILPALLYEFFTSEESLRATIRGGFNQYKKLILFLFAPLGLILYSVFNYYKWGNFLYFIQAQGELGNNRSVNSIVFFPQTVFRYINIFLNVSIISYEWWIAFLELSLFLFTLLLIYIVWKKKIRTSYLIFTLVNFAIIISTGTFSGLPRYILTLFPIFIALALIENKISRVTYTFISPIILFILLMLFSRGYFVA